MSVLVDLIFVAMVPVLLCVILIVYGINDYLVLLIYVLFGMIWGWYFSRIKEFFVRKFNPQSIKEDDV